MRGKILLFIRWENNWSEGNPVKPKSGIEAIKIEEKAGLIIPKSVWNKLRRVGNVFKADLKINLNNHEN